MSTRIKLINETLLLAQKYNDYIDANDLKLTKYDILSLNFDLGRKNKTQVLTQNQAVLAQFNHIKNLAETV